MRPILGLSVLAALALGLVLWLVLWSGDETSTTRTPTSAFDIAEEGEAARPPVDLAGGASDDDPLDAAGSAEAGSSRAALAAAEGRARRVQGRVIDERGRPVVGAIVYGAAAGGFDELLLDEIDPGQPFGIQRAETRTDKDGKFGFDPRMQSKVRLAVRASGFAPLDIERTVAASNPDVGDLVLQQGVVLQGRVVDHVGRPVAGAELRRNRTGSGPFVFFTSRGGAVLAKTDDSGSFRVDMLPVGPWSLRVTSDVAPDKDETGETVRPGEVVSGLVIQLEEGFEIAGVLRGAPPAEQKDLVVAATPRGSDFGGDLGPLVGGQRTSPVAADGTFVVRGCKKDGKYRVSARLGARTFGPMLRSPSRSATVDATAGDRGVELQYQAETAISFQVVDASTGKAIEELSVSAGSRWAAPLTDDKGRAQRQFPGGRVRYGGLRLGGGPLPGGNAGAGDTVTVAVEAAGYAPWERKDVAIRAGSENDLGVVRLERTSVVTVRVNAASSNLPVVGARVSLEEVEDEPSGPPGARTFRFRGGASLDEEDGLDFGGGAAHRGRTDAQGVARVSSLPGKRARLVVRHKEFAEFKSEPIALPVAQDVEQSVTLTAGGTVVVRVVDTRGSPVRDQAVEHRAPGEGDDAPMFLGPEGPPATDAEGRLVLPRQAAGEHAFRLQTGGGPRVFGASGGARFAMARAVREGQAPEEEPWTKVVVTEGGEHEIVLTAPERARVVGRVREGGRPLAGATVRLRSGDGPDMPFFDEGPKAETDGQGEFALENVAAGEYALVVSHPSRVMPHEVEVRVPGGEVRQDVDLPISILEGRVTDEEGQGIPGLRVRAERRGGSSGVAEVVFAFADGDGSVNLGGAGGGTVTTDSDGRYKLRGVLADVDLAVVASGGGVQRTESEIVRVPPDGVRSGVDLVARKGATLEVTCRRPDGTPATPCEVRAQPVDLEDADSKFEITRGDGKARFQGLKPGRWRVTARSLGTGPEDDSSPPPAEQTVDLAVGPAKQITLEIRGG